MIDFAILPLYLTAIVALLLIPGPDMLLIASSSLSYGKKVGVFASLGTATSGVILSILSAAGVSAMIAMSPIALEVLRMLGAVYLLKMGIDCIRAGSTDAPEVTAQKNLAKSIYYKAIFNNLLNPKALLFFVLFLPQFVSTDIVASSATQMFALGTLLNVAGLTFNVLLVFVVSKLGQSLLTNSRFQMYQNKVMGSVFLILAAWLLFSQLPSPVA